MIITNAL